MRLRVLSLLMFTTRSSEFARFSFRGVVGGVSGGVPGCVSGGVPVGADNGVRSHIALETGNILNTHAW